MTVRDEFMQDAYARIREAVSSNDNNSLNNGNALPPTLPQPSQLSRARASLPMPGDAGAAYLQGRGRQATVDHLLEDIAPALNGQNRSSRYWGFVTGAALPVAEVADNLVSAYDQNVQVHLPNQTIATEVEDAALKMLLGVLRLGSVDAWAGRTFTTGATASNILGLACGREAVLARRLSAAGCNGKTASELGILAACLRAGVKEIRVLTSMGHSSLSKAASIVGLGSATVHELPHSADEPWRLDLEAVQKELQREGAACIIVLSAGEVNTGRFATQGLEDMRRLRQMADQYGAWIHIDGAFGIFARALPETDEFSGLHRAAAGLELADSITVDGHKLLNVPYDCGVFFTRQVSVLTSVCQNPNAVYLNSEASDIQSPLNVGLENSRRFRALPAYAVLLSEGREGLADMFARMVRLTRGIAGVVRDSPDYILLPDEQGQEHGADLEDTHICVLFRAKEDSLNNVLVEAINATGLWYVSSTKWKGQKAVRVAVANWRINVTEDQELVRQSLASIAQEHKTAQSKS
ncbi:pyridoxal phosphate-dependent transferase [Apiospora arundinis]|uniref:Pyridoxal phosphate-dependent transferase n=1 Tax=Apiospora arundinis TaxID=335852 RepID=A0ABR2J893_9PEZI